jgi:hypothetical protein
VSAFRARETQPIWDRAHWGLDMLQTRSRVRYLAMETNFNEKAVDLTTLRRFAFTASGPGSFQ